MSRPLRVDILVKSPIVLGSEVIAMLQTRRRFSRLIVFPAVLALLAPAAVFGQEEPPAGGAEPSNVFISPCGKAFRAKPGEPYPVVQWFKAADTNGDGKLDHAEFIADSLAFFKYLDRNGDGVISPQEVALYEQRIVPEVLGYRVLLGGVPEGPPRPRLWRVQGMPGGMGGGGMGRGGMGDVDPGQVEVAPDESGKARPYDASGKGASPFGFFDEPEPVTAADLDFRGIITKANFLRLAEIHFQTLDRGGVGYLTLETLPRTPMQRRLEQHGRRGRHGT
jgi:hypothetical protein